MKEDELKVIKTQQQDLTLEEAQSAYVKAKLETPSINFSNQHNESVGTLYWEDDLMKFKGDVHESAKILFEYVCSMWNDKGKEDE